LEESPTPAGEWPGLREFCGDELLGQILSISHASLLRYAGGERRCPDEGATRLYLLALVVEALEGSYNTTYILGFRVCDRRFPLLPQVDLPIEDVLATDAGARQRRQQAIKHHKATATLGFRTVLAAMQRKLTIPSTSGPRCSCSGVRPSSWPAGSA
jgi:hypothetical protein